MESLIDKSVIIGKNVVIEPFCVIRGSTVLRDGCTVGSFSVVVDSEIGENSIVLASRVTDSKVGQNCNVGPNAHLRNGAVVGDGCRVGNYVEIKKSTLGQGTKASHLAYIGDAEIGSNCNIGCGVIFCNYDGRRKHRTVVGDNVFIGSNCNLVAPLTIAGGTFVACGTTVTKNTGENDFVIGRARAEIKPGRAKDFLGE